MVRQHRCGGATASSLTDLTTAVTRRVYLIDANGNAQLLTNEHLAGSSLTLASVRAMLLARGVGGRNRRGAQPEEEEDEDEEEDDEEEDDDVNPYWGATRKTTKKWYEPVLEPKAAGISLERSGEFGPVSSAEQCHTRVTRSSLSSCYRARGLTPPKSASSVITGRVFLLFFVTGSSQLVAPPSRCSEG